MQGQDQVQWSVYSYDADLETVNFFYQPATHISTKWTVLMKHWFKQSKQPCECSVIEATQCDQSIIFPTSNQTTKRRIGHGLKRGTLDFATSRSSSRKAEQLSEGLILIFFIRE
jgi:hypothetical protein